MVEKVEKCLRWINYYGAEEQSKRELIEMAKYRNIELKEFAHGCDIRLQKYIEEHSKLVVYNRAQWYARQAAIECGKLEFWNLNTLLNKLQEMLYSKEEWSRYAGEYFREGRILIPYQFDFDRKGYPEYISITERLKTGRI